MSDDYHTVSVMLAEPDEDGWRPTEPEELTFTCTAPPDADCRTYPGPDCDCESWERVGDADEYGHPGDLMPVDAFADDFASVLENTTVHRSTIGCIVPAYNEENVIVRTIESVLGSSYR